MYNHILVPLDGSPLAEQVLPHVRALASAGLASKVTLMRAVPREYPDVIESATKTTEFVDPMKKLLNDAHSYLADLIGPLRDEGLQVATEVLIRYPADAILEFAESEGVDLIALATHGRGGLGRWIYGSVTQKIMQTTPVPMLVVRPQA